MEAAVGPLECGGLSASVHALRGWSESGAPNCALHNSLRKARTRLDGWFADTRFPQVGLKPLDHLRVDVTEPMASSVEIRRLRSLSRLRFAATTGDLLPDDLFSPLFEDV
jgi:hypothetical protein